MIVTEKFHIAQVPVLMFADEITLESKNKSAVIMYHGSSANKEIHEKELKSLAERGLIAIGVDSVGHGERKLINLDSLYSHDNPEMMSNMLKHIDETASELPSISEFICDTFRIRKKGIGIMGISMGAMIVYKAVSLCPWINCAAAILGTPKYLEYQSSEYLKSLSKISLLSINAAKDEYICNEDTASLHNSLKKRYKDAENRFIYKEYRDSGHFMLPEDWADAWEITLTFLTNRLDTIK